jgi:hypothetical protein
MTMVADSPAVLVPMRRARLDPVAKLLAAADQAGVQFRWEGRTLRVAGLSRLHPEDAQLLRAHADEIKARLADATDSVDACEQMGVDVELVTDPAVAETIVSGLPASIGLDIETAARPGFTAAEQPWLKITRKGAPYKHQPKNGDAIGLDPIGPSRAPRRCSIRTRAWPMSLTSEPYPSRRSPGCGTAGW